jgi:hypothetical protein
MQKFILVLACFLQVSMSGCMDYVKLEDVSMLGDAYRFPPIIDNKHLSPHPSRLIEPSVHKTCKGQTFKVPPIEDPNRKDRLYYLWFLDNKLALESVIEPESRSDAIITLTIDQQFLLSHFENRFPDNFFDSMHIIDFIVSDVKFTIPESRYIDDGNNNEKYHSDYAYWIVKFREDPC